MLNGKTFLCMLLARGGSSFKNKNLKEICGHSLIYWVMKAVKDSGIFDEIVVNSDSEEIIAEARRYGARTWQYTRPPELATEQSKVKEAIADMINFLEICDKRWDYMFLCTPPTPLMTSGDIFLAASTMFELNMPMVVSVTPTKSPYIGKIVSGLLLEDFEEYFDETRQDLADERPYYLNAAIYIGEWHIFKNKENFYPAAAFVMPRERSVDIDTPAELELAAILLKERLDNAQIKSLPKNI